MVSSTAITADGDSISLLDVYSSAIDRFRGVGG